MKYQHASGSGRSIIQAAGVALSVTLAGSAAHAELIFDHGGSGDAWSTAANWDPTTAFTPGSDVPDADLRFAGPEQLSSTVDGVYSGINSLTVNRAANITSFRQSNNGRLVFEGPGATIRADGSPAQAEFEVPIDVVSGDLTIDIINGGLILLKAPVSLLGDGATLIKTGDHLILRSTLAGNLDVRAGIASLDAANVLGSGHTLTVAPGAVARLYEEQTVAGLSGAGTIELQDRNHAFRIDAAKGEIFTYSGNLTGRQSFGFGSPPTDPFRFVKAGEGAQTLDGIVGNDVAVELDAGTLVLSGNNTYNGGTTLNGGTLALGHNNALGTGGLTVAGDATVTSTDDVRTVNNAITITPGHALTVDGDRNLRLAGTVSGDGSLIKTGPGVLELSAVNTYTGGTTLRGGTLKLHGGSALGGGALAVKADSTLASGVTNPVALNHAVILGDADASANLTFAGNQYFILTGNISGKGNLIQNLNFNILNGSNTFDGDIFLDRGVLQIDNGSSIPDAATVVFSTTADSALAIYESETVGGLSGGKAGHTGIYLYSLYSAGGKAILTVDNDNDHTFAGSISGADGSLTKAGAGELTLTGNSTYTGPTTLDGGTLVVDGSITSPTTLDGGRLEGNGSIGSLTANRGNVAPGNSIGTLTVNGDVNLGSDSVYDVEIHGDGTADRIAATGNATLAQGTALDVTVVGGAELIRDKDSWTVLTADHGLTDNGAIVNADLAGFRFDGLADANAYRLIARATALSPTMTDPTARRVAAALDADAANGNTGNDLDTFINATRNQSTADAQRSLAATTPRPVASTRLAQQRTTERFHTAVSDYLRGSRLGTPGLVNQDTDGFRPGSFQLASAANDPQTLGLLLAQYEPSPANDPLRTDVRPAGNTFDPNWGGFAAAYGVYDDFDADDNRLGSRADTYAGQIGVDYTLNRDLTLGVSFSYAASDLDFDGQNLGNLGSNEVDTYRVGPYLGYTRGPWSADASLTYALNQNDAERRTPGNPDPFTADYDSHDIAAFLGGGYTLDLDGWLLRPEAGLQYVHAWSDGFTETGGPGALDVDDSNSDSLRSTLGVGLSRRVTLGRSTLVPHANVGWAHEYLDDDDTLTARFVGGNSPFTVAAAGRDDDSIYYGAGVTALLTDNTSLDLGYLGETFSDGQTHALRLALRLDF